VSKTRISHRQTALTGLRIEQHENELLLKFDTDFEAIQSAIDIKNPQRLIMHNLQFLLGVLLFMPEPEKILILGIGGGSLVHYFHHYLPGSHITGIEYDAELLEIAHQQLKLPQPSARLDYIVADARDYISQTVQKYDLIVVDIFDAAYSPTWLLQKQFTERLRQCLTPNGAATYNLLIDGDKKFRRFYQLVIDLFDQQTLCMDTEDYENILVYAFNFPVKIRSMTENLQHGLHLSEKYDLPFTRTLAAIYDINPQGVAVI
jgi:spermidine synthase